MTGPLDPGLQSERTSLAWTRTALALVANAFLVLRSGLLTHGGLVTASGITLAVAAIGVAVIGWRRHTRIPARVRDGDSPVRVGIIRATATAAVLAAAVALLAAWR